MRPKSASARPLILLSVAALAFAAPAVQSLARARKPAAEAPAPPPPPPPPPAPAGPVGLPDPLIQDAAAYDTFMREAVSVSPAFSDAGAVTQGLDRARAYAPRPMVRGAVAYGAIAALEDQTFVAALRAAGNTPEHRAQMVEYILANPAYVYGFADSQVAAGLAREALGPRGLRLFAHGKAVRNAAYGIQKQGWSQTPVLDLKGRLAAAEAAANHDMTPEPERLADARRWISASEPLPIIAPPLTPPYRPIVAHALQLAAIAALGEAGEDSYARLMALTTDAETEDCLSAAKRNFHECLAVAMPNYEDVFCMGHHAMMDTGACMARAAGYDIPPDPPAPARAHPAPSATPHRTHPKG